MFLNPQPTERELRGLDRASSLCGVQSVEGRGRLSDIRRATARLHLHELARYRGPHGGRLLEIGGGDGLLLSEAEHVGYHVTGVEFSLPAARTVKTRLSAEAHVVCGNADCLARGHERFDVCVLSNVLDHVRDPLELLALVRSLLRPDGVLWITRAWLDAWSAERFPESSTTLPPERLSSFSFDANTLQHALFRTGFDSVVLSARRHAANLPVVTERRTPTSPWARLIGVLGRLRPVSLRRRAVPVPSRGLLAFARKRWLRPRPRLSVVLPAYNEASTLDVVMRKLLDKEPRDLEMEIILVESASTDGTRELALRYARDPRVKVVLEDRPRGKGYAVRTGFAHATGDFILIQDADLEYDVEDYDALLEPLLNHREAFVLGSRHGGSAWKMRQFAGQRLLSIGLNLGHWLFTLLINVLFRQRLKDPFTMYKVFRRDCLYGLRFECNRFDFDHELVVKLIRKGYEPLEIPVNYRSRSFREGKKVSVWRDPPLWLWALIKLRAARIDPMWEVEHARQASEDGRAIEGGGDSCGDPERR